MVYSRVLFVSSELFVFPYFYVLGRRFTLRILPHQKCTGGGNLQEQVCVKWCRVKNEEFLHCFLCRHLHYGVWTQIS